MNLGVACESTRTKLNTPPISLAILHIKSTIHILYTILRNCFVHIPSLHEAWISSRGLKIGGMATRLPHKQPCACATWAGVAAWCQQLCWVSNILQNLLCYSDYSSVTSILLIAQKAPGTDHGNTVLQFRLAVSHLFYKPPTKTLLQTMVTQSYNSLWRPPDTICWWCVSDTSFTSLGPRLRVCNWVRVWGLEMRPFTYIVCTFTH